MQNDAVLYCAGECNTLKDVEMSPTDDRLTSHRSRWCFRSVMALVFVCLCGTTIWYSQVQASCTSGVLTETFVKKKTVPVFNITSARHNSWARKVFAHLELLFIALQFMMSSNNLSIRKILRKTA